jgi:surface polysaccharide O-acyltransferase-like enzyme
MCSIDLTRFDGLACRRTKDVDKGERVMFRTNPLAVIIAAIVEFVIGGVWYGVLFSSQYIALSKLTSEEIAAMQASGVGKTYALDFLGCLITAYVLGFFIRATDSRTVLDGIKIAFMAFLGFVLTTNFETVLFERRAPGLYIMNNAYHLVAFVLMGIILAAWRKRDMNKFVLNKREAAGS